MRFKYSLVLSLLLLISCSEEPEKDPSIKEDNHVDVKGVWKFKTDGWTNYLLISDSGFDLLSDQCRSYGLKIDSSVVPWNVDLIDKNDTTLRDKGVMKLEGNHMMLDITFLFSKVGRRAELSFPYAYFVKSELTEEDFEKVKNDYIEEQIGEITRITELIENDSSEIWQLNNRALSYAYLDSCQKGLNDIQRLVDLGETPEWLALEFMTNICMICNEDSLATVYINRALEINPKSDWARLEKGKMLCKYGETEQGCEYLMELTEDGEWFPSLGDALKKYCFSKGN